MRQLTLPAKITAAIEDKLSADQESQRMTFVLTKEKQEAERKRIEAQGVADFQRIVTDGISDKLLQWKGIEATQELAKSPNAKIVDHRQFEERTAAGARRREVESELMRALMCDRSGDLASACGCGTPGGRPAGGDVYAHARAGHAETDRREMAREARDRLPAGLGVHSRPASAQGRARTRPAAARRTTSCCRSRFRPGSARSS